MTQSLEARINEVADGNIGVYTALLAARQALGDQTMSSFLDKVPEKGEELWKRFRALQQEKGDWMTFNHLVTSVVLNLPK